MAGKRMKCDKCEKRAVLYEARLRCTKCQPALLDADAETLEMVKALVAGILTSYVTWRPMGGRAEKIIRRRWHGEGGMIEHEIAAADLCLRLKERHGFNFGPQVQWAGIKAQAERARADA